MSMVNSHCSQISLTYGGYHVDREVSDVRLCIYVYRASYFTSYVFAKIIGTLNRLFLKELAMYNVINVQVAPNVFHVSLDYYEVILVSHHSI